MNITIAMLLGLAASIACGCSGSDSDSDSEGLPSSTGLQCGSAALFAATHDACGAMDATGAPDEDGAQCRCLIGYMWTGEACREIAGCRCVGDDCDKLSETQEACEAAHAGCSKAPQGLVCGSTELFAFEHGVCEAMDAKAAPDANGDCFCLLGYAWNGASCEPLANCQCQGTDCDKLAETQEACEQAHASCHGDTQRLHCGSSALYSLEHGACEPMHAKAVADEQGQSCYCFLGFAWNGSACVGLADCACEGEDCDKLAQTQEQCELAHADCP